MTAVMAFKFEANDFFCAHMDGKSRTCFADPRETWNSYLKSNTHKQGNSGKQPF